jgi:hypothetical protein
MTKNAKITEGEWEIKKDAKASKELSHYERVLFSNGYGMKGIRAYRARRKCYVSQ